MLDALGIERAHIVGMSSGGGIGQELALVHADRVATVALLSTSPVGPRPDDRAELPGCRQSSRRASPRPAPEPDWSDREAVIDHIVEGLRPFSGSLPFEEEEAAGARRASRRRGDRHRVEHEEPLAPRAGRAGDEPVSEMTVPTLVLHGTEDPLFPYEHGEALAREIPRAHLVRWKVPATSCRRDRFGTSSSRLSSNTRASRQVRISGAVRYSIADEFLYASNCHCSRCRAATGSAFKPFAGIEREKLQITDSTERAFLIVGEETLNDTRCAKCGSLLFSVVRDGAFAHVALGSLVDVERAADKAHLFVGSKAPWFEITDDLPQLLKSIATA